MIITKKQWKHIKGQESRNPFSVYPDIAGIGVY
jgi:hypothetical protein